MKRSDALRRLVGLVVGAALLLSVAAPARAQFDPMTMSLILGGFQLLTGAISMMSIGMASTPSRTGIGLPYGTPCGMVDGVPQICWQPHAGGFEGSPDLPTGAKSAPAKSPEPFASGTPTLSLGVASSPASSTAEGPAESLPPSEAQGQ
jgi:hypothetical protein